jgi:hypothetical protein
MAIALTVRRPRSARCCAPLATRVPRAAQPENSMGRILKSAVAVVALGLLAGTILRSQMRR